MTPSNPHPVAARTLPSSSARRGALSSWLVASVVVLVVWLIGSLVDRTGVAFGQTVPGAPQTVSTSANTVQKRRPQLAADPATGGVYMVWEEGLTGTNNSNLYYAYRSPATGNWTAPSLVVDPATVNYAGRFGAAGTLVNETNAHIDVDPAGNLHVVYAAARGGVIGIGAYYTVATAATNPGTVNWTAPVRLDKSSYTPSVDGYLLNADNTRLFVGSDPGAAGYAAVGYVLWVGNNGNQLRLTRVGYGPHGPVTPLDSAPLSNPITTSVGPVAVLEIDNATLQLVYAGSSLSTGNGFWGAPLQLNGGAAPTWGLPADSQYRAFLAGTNGNDCNVTSCLGASAVRDDALRTWIASNYDVGTTHNVQATLHDGTPAAPPLSVENFSDPNAGRQPVIVFDTNGPTTKAVVLYNQCSYVSTSSCTAKDMYFRVHDGTTWGSANLTGNTTGDQQDLTAVMVADDLLYAWVGVNQAGTGTGQQVYFHGVQSP